MLDLPHQFNVATHFVDRNVAEGRASRVAFECCAQPHRAQPDPAAPMVPVTYGELLQRVNRAGNALRSLGVRPEERVVLLLLDSPEFAYAFFGAIKIGAVAVPGNTLLKPPQVEYILNDSRARVAIVSEALLPHAREMLREISRETPSRRLPYLQHLVVAGDWGTDDALEPPASGATVQEHSLAALMAAASPHLAPEPSTKDDAAFWLYSSGSTGPPKGCVHLHHDMVVCAEHYAKGILQIRPDDRSLSVAKLPFAYGLGNGLYFPLAVGATSILWPGPPSPANVFALIERYRPTLFYSVPSNFVALLAHHRESGGDFDLSSVRHAVSAGEALPAPVFHRFRERFGVEILDAIGSTECLHMFIANRPGAARAGSSGQLIPGYGARILDEAGQNVPAGEIGNLFIRSDATCACYWGQPEKTKETIQGEWIKTGDKYRLDEDGYYWYCGRSDDMLKVSGAWVSPVEIESTLMEHDAVLEAAVVGREDGERLLKPAAYVVLRNAARGDEALARELQDFVAKRLAGYKRPRWVEFVPELPKTATGKVQRFLLRTPNT